jgi:hypothetical protein
MDALRTGFWLIIVLSTLTYPALAKTSQQLIKEDPRGQYAAIKRVIRPLLESRHEDVKPRLLEHDNTYDFSCSGPRNFYDQFYGSDNKPELELQVFLDLAQEVVLLRLDLGSLVPVRIWGDYVDHFEKQELDDKIDLIRRRRIKLGNDGFVQLDKKSHERQEQRERVLFEELAKVLNEYRRSVPSLPRFVVGSGCEGVGEVAVTIATAPPGAQVMYLEKIWYEFCREQKFDPEDSTRCNRWHEAIDNQLTEVIGDYHYVARWPDGTVRRGQLSFSGKDEGQTIILRKPTPGR